MGGWSIGPNRVAPVARTGPWCTATDANAYLISAAPDLYAAVKGWLAYLDDEDAGSLPEEEKWRTAMEAAISKALGGDPSENKTARHSNSESPDQ